MIYSAAIPALLNKTFPIPGRFRSALPSDIAELSQLLTNRRGDRSLSYLTRPNFLSAYLHYFLPWNLYRLCLILPALDINLSAQDTITDIGCGPLTFASALWISRPDLRKIPLEINCIDRSGPVLDAGKKFFTALAADTENPWKIKLIKEDIDIRKTQVSQKRKQAAFVCAINIFNEIYENLSHNNTEGLRRMAANAALFMHNEASANASILTVEPGVPRSGQFISLLRDEFIKLNRPPAAPCTHSNACPLSGGKKNKWCHFAFDTAGAPKELSRLSAAAKLPKERIVFSFLFTGAESAAKKDSNAVRVISDTFPLPDNCFGRYGCSNQGLVLLKGEKSLIEKAAPLGLAAPFFSANGQRDAKSGALIGELK